MLLVRPPTSARRLAALGALALLASACQQRSIVAAAEVAGCERCHGGNGSAAPPRSATGATDPGDPAIGAHQRHLSEAGHAVGAPVACDGCHVVPTSEQHSDGVVEVAMTGLAVARGQPAPAFDAAAGRCQNVACHGAGLHASSKGPAVSPEWTVVDGTQSTCGSCHLAPPGSHASYPGVTADPTSCHTCHAQTVTVDGTIDLAGGKHIDGVVQAPTSGGCTGCHGAPPSTGAHLAHVNPADPSTVRYGSLTILEDVSPSGGTAYEFGCGHCHPLDAVTHMDGSVDVVLSPPSPAVPGDDIKGRNDAAAAYDHDTQRCSGAYCHSSGQATPVYAATPSWTSAPGALGCGGCHGNPPAYASGGLGSATANSHLGYDDFGYESGHFAGMPGPAHNSKHGGANPNFSDPAQAAAPITCQACHADTVDPANVAAGGFFWLDTTGTYLLDLPGGDPGRFTEAGWPWGQCATCHTAGGSGPLGAGKVLPLRHVNGTRDVAFDRRRTLPAGYVTGLPPFVDADPDPTVTVRPYYVSGAPASVQDAQVVPDAVVRLTTGLTAFTTTLESASYDASTKTCSNVGCHVARQAEVTAGRLPALRWGTYNGFAACGNCHPQ